jgi:predicted ArsR family transcriptional regulator
VKFVETPVADTAADQRTRDRVARLIFERGPQTAAALSDALGLTVAAVRRHLDAMLAAGTIVGREARPAERKGRRRGRPARVFALSDAGHAAMPNAYDDIASAALRFLADSGGEEAVSRFAQARVAELEVRYGDRLAGVAAEDRPAALAEALAADGYAARTDDAGTGVQICQHHCPVQHVAEEFPQLCEAETEAFGRLLGVHVQRLATIAHGDGICTTHVPLTPARPTAGRTSA